MKVVCVLALIFCWIFESSGVRSYKRGTPDPDQLLVYDRIIRTTGKIEFDYPAEGYSSRFVVTVIEVEDYKCKTELHTNVFGNQYGEFTMRCAKDGNQMDSTLRVYGVYDGPCYKKRQVWEFETDTRQKLPKRQ